MAARHRRAVLGAAGLATVGGLVELLPRTGMVDRRFLSLLLGLIGVLLATLFRIVENRTLTWYRGDRRTERGA